MLREGKGTQIVILPALPMPSPAMEVHSVASPTCFSLWNGKKQCLFAWGLMLLYLGRWALSDLSGPDEMEEKGLRNTFRQPLGPRTTEVAGHY